MKRNLILSTLLASSALIAADAFAAVPDISFNKNNKFVVNSKEFNNYKEAERHLEAGVKDKSYTSEEVMMGLTKVSNESKVNLIEYSHKNHSAANSFVELYNDLSPEHEQITLEQFIALSDAISFHEKKHGFTLREDIENDLSHGKTVESYLEWLKQEAPSIIIESQSAKDREAFTSAMEKIGFTKKVFNDAFKKELKVAMNHELKNNPLLQNAEVREQFNKYFSSLLESENAIDFLEDIDSLSEQEKEKLEKIINKLTIKTEQKVLNNTARAEAKKGNTQLEKHFTEILKKSIASHEKLKKLAIVSKGKVDDGKEELKEILDYYRDEVKNAKNVKDINSTFTPDNYTTHAVMATNDANRSTIDTRLSGFNSGVAAGEMFQKFGAWIKGTMSRGEQKTFALEPGYKFDQAGVTIGVDAGDEFVIGAAYSLFNNNVKSVKANDTKEKATTHIATIYGGADFGSFYVNGQVQGGFSNINKDRYSGDLDNHVAKGKTKAVTYGGKVEAGYNYVVPGSDAMITPSLAVSHNDVKVKGYKETGKGLNRKIGNRSSSMTEGTVGLTTKYRINTGGMVVVPELHAFASQAINAKNSATKIYLVDGIDPIVTPGQKLTKTHYKLGAAVNVYAQDSIEASVGYDYGMAKKFQSHTGAVKLRVDF